MLSYIHTVHLTPLLTQSILLPGTQDPGGGSLMSRLTLNVHSKMLTEFDRAPQLSCESASEKQASPAVEAMLCGFILEGDQTDAFRRSRDAESKEDDWYYNL